MTENEHETFDLAELTDEQLSLLIVEAQDEIARRADLDFIPHEMERLSERWAEASGRQPGDPWEQPTGAHDAYLLGWTVIHDGREWESLVPANVWEPGVSGWREAVEDGGVPEWVRPTGAHDAYQTGDLVTFEGAVYESTMDGNVWPPADHPDGWQQIGDPDA